ncbi:hypothetical protein F383_34944 [Gossypium arboreum]|uniref:Uncharacterized protein n=1 Tax=Gossypium arboreum TaxID=29729 RepID=A0A0B0PW78_GOSAR|nr:hypothetical protein F383_34944 [Gossypium arboreum]
MVENQYRDSEMQVGNCPNRAELSGLDDKTKSLVLVNYFHSMSSKEKTCEDNFGDLINMLRTCYAAVGNRWANSVAVDYKRSEGGGSFQAIDTLNGKLLGQLQVSLHHKVDSRQRMWHKISDYINFLRTEFTLIVKAQVVDIT